MTDSPAPARLSSSRATRGQQPVELEDGGVEGAVGLQQHAVQQLADGGGADLEGEQVLHLVGGQRDRRGEPGDRLGQRERRPDPGRHRRVGRENGELQRHRVEQPLRCHAAGAVEVEAELDPAPPSGVRTGVHGEHRPQLDRADRQRHRPDREASASSPAAVSARPRPSWSSSGSAGDAAATSIRNGAGCQVRADRAQLDLQRGADRLTSTCGRQHVAEHVGQCLQRGGEGPAPRRSAQRPGRRRRSTAGRR